jgi:hypothetical protein
MINGRGRNGLYSFRVGRLCANLEERVADFLRYEAAQGRKVIFAAPADVPMDALVERALANTPVGPVVRHSDPQWLVHSTLLERWERVQACGELRSLARLKRNGFSILSLGSDELKDPKDYAEHVALGDMDAIGAEFVTASHGKGRMVTQEDAPYQPGVRLYFDGHRIVRDGLAVRDGLHLIKVCDHLPLKPYLVAAIGVKEADPDGAAATWTPRSFLTAANACFMKMRSAQA